MRAKDVLKGMQGGVHVLAGSRVDRLVLPLVTQMAAHTPSNSLLAKPEAVAASQWPLSQQALPLLSIKLLRSPLALSHHSPPLLFRAMVLSIKSRPIVALRSPVRPHHVPAFDQSAPFPWRLPIIHRPPCSWLHHSLANPSL